MYIGPEQKTIIFLRFLGYGTVDPL